MYKSSMSSHRICAIVIHMCKFPAVSKNITLHCSLADFNPQQGFISFM